MRENGTPGTSSPHNSQSHDEHAAPPDTPAISRRKLLAGAVAAGTAAALGHASAATAPVAPAAPLVPQQTDPTKVAGRLASPLGTRAPGEEPARLPSSAGTSSRSPLQDLTGIITPSDVHFERHHAGVPEIDPAGYGLLIHGMVDRPMVFTLADLHRFPATSRLCFVECSGNGGAAYYGNPPAGERTPQQVDGLTSNSEWTGVRLDTLFREVGVHPDATWFLAEGSDAAVMTRSIPVEKAFDDALIAYGQNGEAIRPEQGYPARLLLPGWEGNACVKWIRRIELSDRPFMTREETSKYSDPLKDGTARLFSFEMDAKSIITSPSYPTRLTELGWYEIRGIAWTGRGVVTRVEVSTDGGATWQDASLDAPVLPKCHTQFRLPWQWEGDDVWLLSRATDETGYVQPGLAVLRDARGVGTHYHYNNIRGWRVSSDGSVTFAAGT